MKPYSEGFRIGSLWFHRKEQWDLGDGEVVPYLCVHWSVPGHSRRIFCVWRGGVQIGRRYFERPSLVVGIGADAVSWEERARGN